MSRTFAFVYCWIFIVALTLGGLFVLWQADGVLYKLPGLTCLGLAAYTVHGLYFRKHL